MTIARSRHPRVASPRPRGRGRGRGHGRGRGSPSSLGWRGPVSLRRPFRTDAHATVDVRPGSLQPEPMPCPLIRRPEASPTSELVKESIEDNNLKIEDGCKPGRQKALRSFNSPSSMFHEIPSHPLRSAGCMSMAASRWGQRSHVLCSRHPWRRRPRLPADPSRHPTAGDGDAPRLGPAASLIRGPLPSGLPIVHPAVVALDPVGRAVGGGPVPPQETDPRIRGQSPSVGSRSFRGTVGREPQPDGTKQEPGRIVALNGPRVSPRAASIPRGDTIHRSRFHPPRRPRGGRAEPVPAASVTKHGAPLMDGACISGSTSRDREPCRLDEGMALARRGMGRRRGEPPSPTARGGLPQETGR